ncbi:hypothetical protein J1N35_038531 [Gossypium stocksii]|uniref:Uncharacterized protein n=1 Tax=Gossypium stocksii TaxID=47602 RepID=A0A9D3ZMV2_9ROSI|nr:hypothetical protein J1N35_038531 [Gossypium stocksii]
MEGYMSRGLKNVCVRGMCFQGGKGSDAAMCRGLLLNNYEFKFSILRDRLELGTTCGLKHHDRKLGFFLPLYVLEVGFHLPPCEFIYEVLKFYEVASRQLVAAS